MTVPDLDWWEAHVEARTLLMNTLLQLLHGTEAGPHASAAWRRIQERETAETTRYDVVRRRPPQDAGERLVELARELSAALTMNREAGLDE